MERIPRHIAIIMDGNGRWARKKNLPKISGHRKGARSLEEVTEICARKGVEALTLYAFSTENWKRPATEVASLMELLEWSIDENVPKLKKNNIRFNVIGRISGLPGTLNEKINRAMRNTADATGMVLTLALNYGGRQEIVDAVKGILSSGGDMREKVNAMDEDLFEEYLYTRGLPELDLIIRTSGEMRLSNFLLWQAAYAEIYVTQTLWPDFGREALEEAIEAFGIRERRFGG